MSQPVDYLSTGQPILAEYNNQTGEMIVIIPPITTPKDRERAKQTCAEAVMMQWRICRNGPTSGQGGSELARGITRVG